jgi:hypothetical protein
MGRKIRGHVPPQASAGCPFGKHLRAGASSWRVKCAHACLNVGRLHDGLEHEKSGKLKFAFSWNLRGGARTQGFLGSRKEISWHGSASRRAIRVSR